VTDAQRHTVFWLVGFALLFLTLWLLSDILLPFAAGFAIAYFLNPLVSFLGRYRVPRGSATTLALLLFLLVIVLILLLLLPIIERQAFELAGRLPRFVVHMRGELERLIAAIQEQLSPEDIAKLRDAVGGRLADVASWSGAVLRNLVTNSLALANLLSLIFVTPVVAFFLLRDWPRILARIDSWLPRPQAETIREQARLIDQRLAGFLRGQLSLCMALGVYYAAALSLLGLDFGLVIGLLVGFLAFLPYIGGFIGFTLSVLLATTQFDDWTHVLYAVLIFVCGWFIEGNFLVPRLIGPQVHLHPVSVIFALLAFGSLFGILGVVIAVPMAAIIGVLVRFALAQYLASPVYDPANAKVKAEVR
jgi:predicted PurR-regulated permease PerM